MFIHLIWFRLRVVLLLVVRFSISFRFSFCFRGRAYGDEFKVKGGGVGPTVYYCGVLGPLGL